MKIGAIIVGAGSGERLGGGIPKCLRRIDNIPMLIMAAWQFEKSESIDSIVLVIPPACESEIYAEIRKFRFGKVAAIVEGGALRQNSVAHGLDAMPKDIEYIVVHDGARPLIDIQLINQVTVELSKFTCVTVATHISDTLHTLDSGRCTPGPDRALLVSAQTPQGFERSLLDRALRYADENVLTYTDEVTLVSIAMGIPAAIVIGSSGNVKITRPEDLEFFAPQLHLRAQSMLREKV